MGCFLTHFNKRGIFGLIICFVYEYFHLSAGFVNFYTTEYAKLWTCAIQVYFQNLCCRHSHMREILLLKCEHFLVKKLYYFLKHTNRRKNPVTLDPCSFCKYVCSEPMNNSKKKVLRLTRRPLYLNTDIELLYLQTEWVHQLRPHVQC